MDRRTAAKSPVDRRGKNRGKLRHRAHLSRDAWSMRQRLPARSKPGRLVHLMTTLESMLRSHPRGEGLHPEQFVQALTALAVCAEACTICADACLAETGHV